MYRNFEESLANHCAPVLFCKKPAALLAADALPKECAWALLQKRGFHTYRLCWRGEKTLMLIYHPQLLAITLAQNSVREKLGKLGYPVHRDARALLSFLRRRFFESMEFPHEVGFFLGYPPEDVIGFIDCKECKLCGQWKVFGDVKRAEALFEEYAHCRKALLRHIENGGSILTADLPALAG